MKNKIYIFNVYLLFNSSKVDDSVIVIAHSCLVSIILSNWLSGMTLTVTFHPYFQHVEEKIQKYDSNACQ